MLTRLTLGAILLATGMMSQPFQSTIAQAQTAGVCAPQRINVTGKAFRKRARAEKNARRAWQRAIRRQMGNRWANYGFARGKSMVCKTTGRQVYCRASGNPCNYGRRTLGDTPGVTN